TRGLLAPALVGIAINGLLLFIFATNFLAARARAQRAAAAPAPSVFAASWFSSFPPSCDGQTGELAADYEYTPFGEMIRATGPLAADNLIRFSSKYFDCETGLANFGFRFYNPGLGRFINRDPKGEPGWANLLADVGGGAAPSWGYIGQVLQLVHERRYGGRD